MNKKTKRIIIIGAALLCVLIAVFAVFHDKLLPKGIFGSKTITIEVIANDTDKSFTIRTDEAYLRGALEQKELIKGTESEYGLFVTEVNGITADSNKQEWWCFTKGGESVMTGVDETPIENGDKFEITLTKGYD